MYADRFLGERESRMIRAAKAALSDSDRELLMEVCARNQSAEIQFLENGQIRSARVRLIAFDDEVLRTDRPQCIGREVHLRDHMPLTVYFAHNQSHFAFRSEVARAVTNVELNQHTRVTGMAIQTPVRLRRQQRRQDFRLSLAKYDIQVRLHEVSAADINLVPLDAVRFVGRLTNISAGGVGILCEAAGCPKLEQWATHFMLFRLPQVPQPFVLAAEVRHARGVHDGLERIVGMSFIQPREPQIRIQIQRVAKFIADEQRRQLRERRGRGPR
jgi:c-di-GMP-binding flagellar brake protein YcgR